MTGIDLSRPGVAVVTGGASGIGLALARAFVEIGWAVALADVDPDALERAAGELAQPDGTVLAVPTDVADDGAVRHLADRVTAELGVPHVVCNNAGVNAYGYRSWEAPPETWRWIWDVNVMGVVHGISAFVPLLLDAGRGRIVNTASVAGLASAPGVAQYAASKHAVVAISETLRFELAEAGSPVGVTVVCPGIVATRIGSSARNWPSRLGEPATHNGEAGRAYSERLETARTDAPGPEGVATAVLAAVAADRFLVFPDEETESMARQKRMAVFDDLDSGDAEWF